MAIVTSYDWESDTFTHHAENSARQSWRDAVAAIAAKAKQTLPDCAGRVDRAVAIVLNHEVELMEDGQAKVASQSNGKVVYYVVNGACPCKDYEKAPSHWCKHRIAAGLYKRATALVQRQLNGAHNGQGAQEAAPAQEETPARQHRARDIQIPEVHCTQCGQVFEAKGDQTICTLCLKARWEREGQQTTAQEPAPAPTTPEAAPAHGIPAQYVVLIQGRPFVKFAGLLTMAHERGLVALTATWIYNDTELSLAHAVATFQDGRRAPAHMTVDICGKKFSPTPWMSI